MKLIALSAFSYTQVCDQDYGLLSRYRWWQHIDTRRGSHYAYTYHRYSDDHGVRRRRKLYMHRLITQCPEDMVVDHWDHDGLNNQRWNLRIASFSQNAANIQEVRCSLSGFRGVSPHGRRWRVRIIQHGVEHHLGLYDDAEAGARAYDVKARELFGIFAWQNFSPLLDAELLRRRDDITAQEACLDIPF